MIGALAPILIDLGAPILGGILRQQVGGVAGEAGGKVIEALGEAFGTEPDAGQVKAAIDGDPKAAREIVRRVEAERGPEWAAYLTAAVAERSALLSREDERGPFAWAWRPAMSWLLLGLWAWNAVALPVVNALAGGAVAPIPWEHLLGFSGLWLAIYGGGHTLKSVLRK